MNRYSCLSLSIVVMGLYGIGAQPSFALPLVDADPGIEPVGVEQTAEPGKATVTSSPSWPAPGGPASAVTPEDTAFSVMPKDTASPVPLEDVASPVKLGEPLRTADPEDAVEPQVMADPAVRQGAYVTEASALMENPVREPETLAATDGLAMKPEFSAAMPPRVAFPSQPAVFQEDGAVALEFTPVFAEDLAIAPAGPLLTPTENEDIPLTAEPLLAQTEDEDIPAEEFPPGDPELGTIRVRGNLEDPELGILRIREQPTVPIAQPQEPRKIGFFTARLSGASSDNILLVQDDLGGLTGDEYLRPGVTLAFYPALGPQTVLIGTVDVSLQRYTTEAQVNYDDLRFRLGVRQGLTPRTYAQLMFSYQQLFRAGPPRFRFFENTALGLTIGRRDPLTSRLVLNTYYQIQLNDAEARPSPTSATNYTGFDRVSQYFGGYLGYMISPQFETGISYQGTLSDYTGQERYDAYHQVVGQLVYRLTPSIRMSIYGGWSFGRSSQPNIRFDDRLFGFTIDATVGLF